MIYINQSSGRLFRLLKPGVSAAKQGTVYEYPLGTPQIHLPKLPQHIDIDYIKDTALAVVRGHHSKEAGANMVRQYHGTMLNSYMEKLQIEDISTSSTLTEKIEELRRQKDEVVRELVKTPEYDTVDIPLSPEDKKRKPWTLGLIAYYVFLLICMALTCINGTSVMYGYLRQNIGYEGGVIGAVSASLSAMLIPSLVLYMLTKLLNPRLVKAYLYAMIFCFFVSVIVFLGSSALKYGNTEDIGINEILSMGLSSDGSPTDPSDPSADFAFMDDGMDDSISDADMSILVMLTAPLMAFFGSWSLGSINLFSNLTLDILGAALAKVYLFNITSKRGIVRNQVKIKNPLHAEYARNIDCMMQRLSQLRQEQIQADHRKKTLLKLQSAFEEKAAGIYFKKLLHAQMAQEYLD
jgi:hypothetical protein